MMAGHPRTLEDLPIGGRPEAFEIMVRPYRFELLTLYAVNIIADSA
jgi:hypothetical protein